MHNGKSLCLAYYLGATFSPHTEIEDLLKYEHYFDLKPGFRAF